jgi:hypothetical protein
MRVTVGLAWSGPVGDGFMTREVIDTRGSGS